MKENIERVPIEKIRESKSNPRKIFNPVDEKELVESIKASGIVTPLLLREIHDQAEIPYEVVDGARRLRAAKFLKIPDVSAIVRPYTEEEAYEVQLISFAQRVDIDPLDEAAAYEQLRKKKFDIAQIAAKVGKERSYIAKRLQLITLIELAKKQLRDGRISLAHAIEIARLQPEAQKEALDEIHYNAGTAAELREWIRDYLMGDLNGAAFKKDDATLVPKAGPCTVCPKRSGNNLDLFGDISKKGNHCLDRKCFDAKLEAFQELNKAKEKERGEEGSSGKAPVSMARRKELYERRLEIFENRIQQEARLRQFKSLLLRLKWPVERKDFEWILCRLLQKGNFSEDPLEQALGIREGDLPDVGYGDEPEMKPLSKLTDQQLVQLTFGIILEAELITDPLMRIPEDSRLASICSRHGVDRKKIREEVAKEMEAKKPKPPKVEKPKKKVKTFSWFYPGSPGTCRVCGCTNDKPCTTKSGKVCCWTDNKKTLCDDPACLAAAKQQKMLPRNKAKKAKPETTRSKEGICRICGCTQTTPCISKIGVACAWTDKSHTLCDNLKCIEWDKKAKAKAKLATKKKTPKKK